MNKQLVRWDRTSKIIRLRNPEIRIREKKFDKRSKIIAKILFWMNYMKYTTTMYPKILLGDKDFQEIRSPITLQHEWVHFEDEKTLFGLSNKFPKINYFIFSVLYLFPQCLAIFSIFAIINPWFLLFLLFFAPFPAPFRMIAEVRAYRRTLELGGDIDKIVDILASKNYYFAWPFKKWTRKLLLKKISPYKKIMDEPWSVE